MAKKDTKKPAAKKVAAKKNIPKPRKLIRKLGMIRTPITESGGAGVLDRLYSVVTSRRDSSPELSHSARLLARGTAKVAQKFGEEAVECLIEAVAGNRTALIGESADVLYHLIVMWVDAGVQPQEVWAELERREGVSGIAEKASRVLRLPVRIGGTRKIP